jgi:hypothetical protein
VDQYNRAKALLKSILNLRAKFHRAKEQLRKYKKKAQSFYRQLTFASWGWDASFGAGYIGGIETFREWVKKPGNFFKVEIVFAEDLLPSKGIAEEAQTIGQKEMSDCRGIKYKVIHENTFLHPNQLVRDAIQSLEEFKEACDKGVGQTEQQRNLIPTPWHPLLRQ